MPSKLRISAVEQGVSFVKVKVLSGIDRVPRDAWNGLLTAVDPPVLRWEWLHALESSGCASHARGWDACHFTLWSGDRLIGAAPAWLKHHSMGEYVYDFAWANAARSFGLEYYPKLLVGVPLSPLTARRFLVAPGEDEAEVRRVLLEAVLELGRKERLSSVHVIFPPEAEAAALEQLGLFRRLGMQYHWRNPGYRTYDDYLSRFDSKRRHQLKHERGAAAKQGISLRTVRGEALTAEHATIAYRFYEATVEKNGWGQVQLNREFFERAFATLKESVELVVAERAGKTIAGAFNLSTSQRLYGRYWGCFEEHPFLHFHVCLYHSVDDCIQRGLKVFEPGAGGEHKVSRGFVPTAIHSAHRVFEPRFEKAVQSFCARERAQVEEVLREGEKISGLKPWAKQ
jgi:predicted N-acyltransferase